MSMAFLMGWQDSSAFVLRGMGHSVKPMVTVLTGKAALRVFWILVVVDRLGRNCRFYGSTCAG